MRANGTGNADETHPAGSSENDRFFMRAELGGDAARRGGDTHNP
jgi:hypothetical protein